MTPEAQADAETIQAEMPGKKVPAEVLQTFELRPDLAKAYISTDGKQWFFDKVRAIKYIDGFSVVDNPHHAKKG